MKMKKSTTLSNALLTTTIFLAMAACTRSRGLEQTPAPKDPAKVEQRQDRTTATPNSPGTHRDLPAGKSDSSTDDKATQIKMTLPEALFTSYALDPDSLVYELTFRNEGGKTLHEIDGEKLPYDEDSKSATVSFEATVGDKGRVTLAVIDTSDKSRFEGTSKLITVEKDSRIALKLKKVDGSTNDAEVEINIRIEDNTGGSDNGGDDNSGDDNGGGGDDNSGDDNGGGGDDNSGDDNGGGGDEALVTYVDVESPLAENCGVCHRPGGQFSGVPLTDFEEIYSSRVRVMARIKAKTMPIGSYRLSDAEFEKILQWEKDGFKEEPSDDNGGGNDDGGNGDDGDTDEDLGEAVTYKPFDGTASREKMNEWVRADQAKRGGSANFYKYVFVDSDFYQNDENADIARIGILKALNSTSMDNDKIAFMEDVSEGHGIVFAFDIRKFWGSSAERKWRIVQTVNTSGLAGMISAPQGGRLRSFNGNLVSASRLVFNVTFPDIYLQLIEAPAYERNLIAELGISTDTCEAWAAQKVSIVDGSRVACMRRTSDGRIYWATGDDFDGNPGDPVPYLTGRHGVKPGFRREFFNPGGAGGMVAHPGASTVASEAWVEMKNGLIAYYIWGNAGQRRGRAELFVEDPRNIAIQYNYKYLETGRSCFTCHHNGVQAAPSDMAKAIEEGQFSGQTLETAKRYWTTNAKLREFYGETSKKFLKSMKTIVYGIAGGDAEFKRKAANGGTEEPILMLVQKIDRSR